MLQIDTIALSIQPHGGISVYTHELIKHLSKKGVDYQVTIEQPSRNLFEIPGPKGRQVARPGRILERYRPIRVNPQTKIVHSSYYRIPSDPKIKSIVTVYDFIYERYSSGLAKWIHSYQKNLAIKRADGLICISRQTHDDLFRYAKTSIRAPVKVIYCGVGKNFTPTPPKKPLKPFILFVGARSGYKNFSRLADVMNLQSDYELVCVGGGPIKPDELKNFSPRARNMVKHLGFVDEIALNNLYNNALCLMYLSDYEGFGIPVAEALNAGCPVVCGDCSAVREIGGNALEVIRDLSPEGLLAAIQRLRNPEYRDAVIQVGLEAGKKFSWEICHNKTIDFYTEIQMA